MVVVSEQQLSIIGHSLTDVLAWVENNQNQNQSQGQNQIMAEAKSVLNLVSSLYKQAQAQTQKQTQGLKGGSASAYIKQHEESCSTCASGQIKELLRRCIPIHI